MLTFHPFEPLIPCGDGSPAGIYMEDDPKIPLVDNPNHILVFVGGGACTNSTDCNDGFDIEPFKFSTSYNPISIQGHNLLSKDSSINVLHEHFKWLVPYCSQDFFLGDRGKGQVGNFIHAGSDIFDAAMMYWQNAVIGGTSTVTTAATRKSLQDVVIVGSSAGAIGVANKIDTIRAAIQNVTTGIGGGDGGGVSNLRIVLDSPTVISDRDNKEKDWRQMMSTYVNTTDHPLCNPLTDVSLLYVQGSALPCCLSTHCLLRHDRTGLASFYDPLFDDQSSVGGGSSSSSTKETLLMLDSAYDSFATLVGSFEDEEEDDGGGDEFNRNDINDLWYVVEFAGQRKTRALETVALAKIQPSGSITLSSESRRALEVGGTEEAGGGHSLEKRVHWIFTSCVTHTFMVNTVEFLHLSCQYGNYKDEDFNIVCSDDGFAIEYEAKSMNLKLKIWRTTDTWNLVEFQGQSIGSIIASFVVDTSPSPITEYETPWYLANEVIDFRMTRCSGPNCLEEDVDTSIEPSCQALIEIENSFHPVPTSVQIFWFAIILFLILSMFLRRIVGGKSGRDVDSSTSERNEKEITAKPATTLLHPTNGTIRISGINVATVRGRVLLSNVSIVLKPGSINGLAGRSGSGKSTLLRALSQLKQPGIKVTIEKGHKELHHLHKEFLRQEDTVAFSKLSPAEYLQSTAKIYGANSDKFNDLFRYTKELFEWKPTDTANDNDELENDDPGDATRTGTSTSTTHFNPFFDSTVENVSGGQKRILSIMSTLILEPQLLLLDEPLSGLDRLSSLQVLQALKVTTELRQCTVLLVLHQPSKSILSYFDEIILLSAGRVVENNRSSLNLAPKPPELIFKTSGLAVVEENSKLQDVADEDAELNSAVIGNMHPPSSSSSTKGVLVALKQVHPLAQRIQLQFGWAWMDVVGLTFAVSLVAAAFRFEHVTQAQTLLLTMAMIALPTVIFPHKIVEYCFLWSAHRLEMDDGRVSPLGFQLATSLFTYPVPILAIIFSTAMAYLIIDWNFNTFLIQVLFSVVKTMIALQMARTLAVAFRGKLNPVVKSYTIYLFVSFLFSSVPVATLKLPPSLRWIFLLSVDFWAISGAVLNQFDEDASGYSNSEDCFDFLTCIMSDGNVIVRAMGFAPLSTSFRAIIVLSVCFWFLFLMEYIFLRFRCAVG